MVLVTKNIHNVVSGILTYTLLIVSSKSAPKVYVYGTRTKYALLSEVATQNVFLWAVSDNATTNFCGPQSAEHNPT